VVERAGTPLPLPFPQMEAPSEVLAVREARIAAASQQRIVDSEVRITRTALLRALRRRSDGHGLDFLAEDFLALADGPTLFRAILDAATGPGGGASADLQLYDRRTGVLRIAAHHGFPREFLAFFATVGASAPTACAAAVVSGAPVLVDDVTRSAIFAGRSTLEPMLAAGSRAVSSYPLRTPRGEILGVLSFHHRTPRPGLGRTAAIADGAARALAYLSRAQGAL
jgi:hypothetical protein